MRDDTPAHDDVSDTDMTGPFERVNSDVDVADALAALEDTPGERTARIDHPIGVVWLKRATRTDRAEDYALTPDVPDDPMDATAWCWREAAEFTLATGEFEIRRMDDHPIRADADDDSDRDGLTQTLTNTNVTIEATAGEELAIKRTIPPDERSDDRLTARDAYADALAEANGSYLDGNTDGACDCPSCEGTEFEKSDSTQDFVPLDDLARDDDDANDGRWD